MTGARLRSGWPTVQRTDSDEESGAANVADGDKLAWPRRVSPVGKNVGASIRYVLLTLPGFGRR